MSRKCFPHLSETEAPRVIENMVRDALAEILEEPRVLIHVHPDLVEALNARIGEVAAAANFEGQILIIDDETMASGDCRVTWSSGSAERDMGALWQHIDEIVEHNLHAVKLGLETPETESTDDIDVSDATHDDIMTTAEPSAPTPASTVENEIASDDEAASVSPSPPDIADIEEEYSLDINELDEQNAVSSDEDQPITDAIDTPLSTDLPDDPPDTTEIHLQAGPGNVEEPSDEAILGPEKSSDEAEDEKTEDPAPAGSD